MIPNDNPQIHVTIPTAGYNALRYSHPWIARVTAWPTDRPVPALHWGTFIGDDSAGELSVFAAPGDIIRWGQRDGRRPDKSTAEYGVVAADGKIHVITAVTARHVHLGQKPTLPAAETLTF